MKSVLTTKMLQKGAKFMLWRTLHPGRFRSAITGRFVSVQYAYKHQRTTVNERHPGDRRTVSVFRQALSSSARRGREVI